MLKKIVGVISSYWLMFFVLLIAITFRFVGVKPGYPPYHPDEGISYYSAVTMIKNSNFDPGRYDYPALVPVINYIFFNIIFMPLSWAGFLYRHLSEIADGLIKLPLRKDVFNWAFQIEILGVREINALYWGRFTTALFGVGSVILTYLLSKKLFGKTVAIGAAFLLAVNFRSVLNSRLGLPDVYNSFFLLLAVISSVWVLEKPSIRNYLLAGFFSGLSVSIKYQVFAFVPIVFVHAVSALGVTSWRDRVKEMISPKILIVFAMSVLVFVFINPYLFLRYEQAVRQVTDVALKYNTGANFLIIYPYYYLYKFGLGELLSFSAILGVCYLLIKSMRKLLVLLPVLVTFFLITTYFTHGGFYTRNYITVMPLLVIFSALGLYAIARFVTKVIGGRSVAVAFLLLVLVSSFGNIENSYIVAREYTKKWNYEEIMDRLIQLPPGLTISAHSSVPLPATTQRLPFDENQDFTLSEFNNSGADLAIANLDWTTNSFYDWMKMKAKWPYIDYAKPVDKMQNYLSALTLSEISDYTVYSVINPWQAPDSNYILVEVPKFKVASSTAVKSSVTDLSDCNGWVVSGYLPGPNLMGCDDGELNIMPFVIVESVSLRREPIDISGWNFFELSADTYYSIKDSLQPDLKGGYFYLSFYSNYEDAVLDRNRVGVRISSRGEKKDTWIPTSLVRDVPAGSTYVVVNFSSYSGTWTEVRAKNIKIRNVDVYDQNNIFETKKIMLDEGVLYPNSHGNL